MAEETNAVGLPDDFSPEDYLDLTDEEWGELAKGSGYSVDEVKAQMGVIGDPHDKFYARRNVASQGRVNDIELYNGPEKGWANAFARQHDGHMPTWEDRADAEWGASFAEATGKAPELNDWRTHFYVKYAGRDPEVARNIVRYEATAPGFELTGHPSLYADDLDPDDLKPKRVPKDVTLPTTSGTGGISATGSAGGTGESKPSPPVASSIADLPWPNGVGGPDFAVPGLNVPAQYSNSPSSVMTDVPWYPGQTPLSTTQTHGANASSVWSLPGGVLAPTPDSANMPLTSALPTSVPFKFLATAATPAISMPIERMTWLEEQGLAPWQQGFPFQTWWGKFQNGGR
jgi:hypothetical protein